MHPTSLLFGSTLVLVPAIINAAPAPLMLASEAITTAHLSSLDLSQYSVSEKLDGIRAYWNGQQLQSRSGYPISAPPWFTQGWPATPMDGELWIGRGRFAEVSGISRSYKADDRLWRQVQYRVFDLPAQPATFDQRQRALQRLLEQIDQPWVSIIEQRLLGSQKQLEAYLAQVSAEGGEGLMLQRRDALYHIGRSSDVLKYKQYQDAEAVVTGYQPGSGKYEGMVGALRVTNDAGQQFSLGSGLSDAQRRDPPPLGSRVTYRYNGLTAGKLPRFARFLRIRLD
ncbi:DNA ligase [Marinobacterium aestuarii]|uniref:DNA ligase n=1 Tax=Marinobacterium aestuarii TaxID=1821621 RepID=A0A1A9EW76_9GAMM|nr:DNA ligase [Marinobacterium aestuarii]ANG61799.1 DNA ligase [Marinobacterium aestuarii]